MNKKLSNPRITPSATTVEMKDVALLSGCISGVTDNSETIRLHRWWRCN